MMEDQLFGELNQTQLEHIGHVLNSGRHLLSLINDMLDLAKVESGKMELEPEELDLKKALESSLLMVTEKASSRNIKLVLRLDPDLSNERIWADETKFKQIMFNLPRQCRPIHSRQGSH